MNRNFNEHLDKLSKRQQKIESVVNAIADHFHVVLEEEELHEKQPIGGMKILEKMQRGIKTQYGFNQAGNQGKKGAPSALNKQKSTKLDKTNGEVELGEEEKSQGVRLIAKEEDRP